MYARETKKSIGDLTMQLNFLYKELSDDYKNTLAALKSVTSIQEASDIVLTQFERPADQSNAVKIKRAGYARTYFNTYSGQSESKPANTPSSIKYITYTVKSGDTLSSIAKRYNTTYQKIATYNNIKDANKIYVGQKIKIQSTGSSAVKSDNAIAREVIAGKWGVGIDRRNRLEASGYDYAKIQALVNKMLSK